MRFYFILALFFYSSLLFAQSNTIVYGKVTDTKSNKPIEATINVFIKEGESLSMWGSYRSDSTGYFEFETPADKELIITFSNLAYKELKIIRKFKANTRNQLNKTLELTSHTLSVIQVKEEVLRNTPFLTISPKTVKLLPSVGGGIEQLIKMLPGVSSNNELSSQYSVRGGNYDENLIYVNDIEIYRPFLIRSGQQEGLSFINPDLVSSVAFSAGGFDAKYGDKMSSVLDIQYRSPRPNKISGTVTGSLLGGAVHLEGSSKDSRLRALMGIRRQSNQYILKSLDIQGDYKPSFTDGQLFLAYDISDKWEVNGLGNFAQNKYLFVPQTRQTDFGTFNEALRFTVYFDGKEVNRFNTYMGAVSGIYKPDEKTKLKFITSTFRSIEEEAFDVQGQYFIDQIETDYSKSNFGDVILNRGVGTYLNHARNYLDALIYNIEHKGYHKQLQWGVKYQHETIQDQLSEWRLIDSAGYSLPQANPALVELKEVIKQKINISSNRYTSYIQNSWNFGDTTEIYITAGIRANYWDFNQQLLISPRTTIALKPNWKKDFLFRFSTGFYHQPPFYRELRDFKGSINNKLQAQSSVHFVLGSDYNFKAWNRPFKFVAEMYYKYLYNLIPYEIDNVRIRYYAKNNAVGYATGIDMRVNGEFVKGIESWASLSVMQTKENLKTDYYYNYYNQSGQLVTADVNDRVPVDSVRRAPGYIPRLTDQTVTFSILFQDYIPGLPTYKMHLGLFFGSGLPYVPPNVERYKGRPRMTPYRRVDIGFSKELLSENRTRSLKNPFRYLDGLWVSLEIFNLLQINNTVSHSWVKDVTNNEYAIPNYLTSRRVNVKLVAKF